MVENFEISGPEITYFLGLSSSRTLPSPAHVMCCKSHPRGEPPEIEHFCIRAEKRAAAAAAAAAAVFVRCVGSFIYKKYRAAAALVGGIMR